MTGAGSSGSPPAAAPHARLVSLADGREYAVVRVPFRIGREQDSDLVIAAGAVMARHAELVSAPGGHSLVDLSNQGVWVNGRRLTAPVVLRGNDLIRIGDSDFRYQVAETAAPAPGANPRLGDTMMGMPALRRPPAMPPMVAEAPTEPLATLLVKRGQRKGERLPVRTPTSTIGRGDYNDIALPDTSISADHARLQFKEGVWVLTDLGSTNGSRVDGAVVHGTATLSPGSQIVLGEVTLAFEPRGFGGPGVPAASGTVATVPAAKSRTALILVAAAVLLGLVAYLVTR
jgi:pSer/pThr/pTyr-binding forkhead associated (FHA) protein